MSDTPRIFGDTESQRSGRQALWRGLKKKCPSCGQGNIFAGYVKTSPRCSNCDLDLSGHRADDGPPYFTMLIAGHLIIPMALEMKRHLDPPLIVQFMIWPAVLLLFTLLLLPMVKGALIGIQWANRMHGFSDESELDDNKRDSVAAGLENP